MRKHLTPLLLRILLCSGVVLFTQTLFAQTDQSFTKDTLSEYVPGELFFKVKDDRMPGIDGSVVSAEIMEGLKKSGYLITNVKQAFRLPDEKLRRIYLVEFADTAQTQMLMKTISAYEYIEYAERVPLYHLDYTPNDLHPNQYNLRKINAEAAWNISQGSASVVVAVVDDGVVTWHEDIQGNMWQNPGEVNGGGDDDGNGYVDDINGFDVADWDNTPIPNTGFDIHGTHCAGIVAATTNNGKGIASIGFNVKIMAVKVESSQGGFTHPFDGVAYAIAAGADVISMSWGGNAYSATYQTLFNTANSQGIVLVGAAGNNTSAGIHYPAGFNHVIAVGSTDSTDKISSFSNYGTWVDVMAPGSDIWSTLGTFDPTSYGYLSGTSMACPLVAGLCALMLSHKPGATPAEIESCLKAGCENIDAINPTFVGQLGAGRINAYNSLMCFAPCTVSLSSTGQSVGATAGSASFSVTANSYWTVNGTFWATPASSGGTGNGTVTINYLGNPTTASRSFDITVSCGGVSKTFTITQAPGTCDPNCTNATALTCGQAVTGTTVGATSCVPSYYCSANSETGPEKIYQFTPAYTGIYTFKLSGMTVNLDILLLSSCSPAACIQYGDTSVSTTLTIGYTYYIVVDGRAGAEGAYTLTTSCSTQPACTTLSCSQADTIACGETVTGFTFSSPRCASNYSCNFGWNETGGEDVFIFTPATTNTYTFALSGLDADLDIFILSSCSAASCIAYDESSVSATLTAGATYYVVVDGRAGAYSDYFLTSSSPACPPPPPCTTLDCTNATLLQCGSTNGTTVGLTNCADNYSCNPSWDESGPEKVYKFIATHQQTYTFSLTGFTSNLDLFLLNGCSTTSCLEEGNISIDRVLTAGSTYYVVVDGRNGASSPFILTVACCSELNCANASTLACGVPISGTTAGLTNCVRNYPCAINPHNGDEKVYEFIPTTTDTYTFKLTNVSYFLDIFIFSNCSASSCIAMGDHTVSAVLTAGATYYVAVDGLTGMSGPYTLTTTCSEPACTTLSCNNATTLSCGQAVTSTTVGSTNCAARYSCDTTWYETAPEKVFQFTPTTTGTHTFNLSNMTADLDVFILSSCSTASCIAYGNASASASLTAGATYYIVVDGKGAAGAFTLSTLCCTLNCTNATTLTCGQPVSATTAGLTNCAASYSCNTAWTEAGNEKMYKFTPAVSGTHIFSLSNMTVDLDIFILGSCADTTCIAYGDDAAMATLTAGVTYFIIVDGKGVSGSFTLNAVCACTLSCANATTLTCGIVSGTTAGLTNCAERYACQPGTNESGPEIVYQFTPTTTGTHTFTLSGMAADLDIFILSSCSTAACLQYGDISVFASLTAGTTYYIVVDGRSGASGTFSLTATCPPTGCTTINCANATPRNCGGTISGTTVGVASRCSSYACNPAWNESGGDVVFQFTPTTTGLYTFALSEITADLDIFILGSCSTAHCIAYGDVAATATLTAGATYYIIVEGRNGASGFYKLNVLCAQPCATSRCTNPPALQCGQTVSGTTQGSTNCISYYSCNPDLNESGPENVYQFTPLNTGQYTFSVSAINSNIDVFVFSNCASTGGCVAYGNPAAIATLTAGNTYYVAVDAKFLAQSPYTLTTLAATCLPPPCTTLPCTNATTLTCGAISGSTVGLTNCAASYSCDTSWNETGPEKVYKFIPTTTGTHTFALSGMTADLDVFILSSCSTTTCTQYGDTSATASLTAGVTYYVVVDGRSGASGSFTLTTSCPTPPCTALPCANATTLTCGAISGSTVGLTNCAASYSCDTTWNESGPEKVYKFIPTTTGTHTFALSGMTVDLDVFILSSCSSASCIQYGDTSASGTLTAGTTYYIVVDGRTGAEGTFTLTTSCALPPPCTALPCTNATTLTCGTVSGTTVGLTNCAASYSCDTAWNESGTEKVYKFIPTTTGTHTFALSGMTVDLDIFILSSCSPTACTQYGDTSASASLTAGVTYYIVVDGKSGAESTFTLTASCPPPPPCTALPCSNATALVCGQAVSSTTVGLTNCAASYSCDTTWNESGPEKVYKFIPITTGTHTFALSGMIVDLDVFILSSCSTASCIQSGDASASASLTAGATYYIVVDGRSGAEGTFTLTATCPPVTTDGGLMDEANDLRIDPNPVSDNLIISSFGSEYRKVEIRLYDIQGKELLKDETVFSIEQTSYFINMQALPNGIYQIVLQTSQWRQVKKVTVAR